MSPAKKQKTDHKSDNKQKSLDNFFLKFLTEKEAADDKVKAMINDIAVLDASKTITPDEASDRFIVDIEYREGKSPLKVFGRPQGLMKNQGDHVTAISVVERATKKIFANNIKKEDLFDREALTEARDKLYKLISALGSLCDAGKDEYKSFFKGIEKIQNKYNEDRFSKTELDELQESLDELPESSLKLKDSVIKLIDHTYKTNAKALVESLENMSELVLSSFNKMPNVAFPKIEGYEAPSNEGSQVRTALSKLDELSQGIGSAFKGPTDLSYINDLAGYTNDLFFYPAIDEEKLKKQTSPIKRNNELGTFEEVLAKHIFLMEQAYPALFDKKNGLKDQLISKFVGKAVTAGNWQRILTTEKQDVAALTLAVRDKLSKLESFKDNHDYKESSQHNASSSDDEVEKLPIKSSIPLDQEMSQTAQQQTQNTK